MQWILIQLVRILVQKDVEKALARRTTLGGGGLLRSVVALTSEEPSAQQTEQPAVAMFA
jgi:hypothetical protein